MDQLFLVSIDFNLMLLNLTNHHHTHSLKQQIICRKLNHSGRGGGQAVSVLEKNENKTKKRPEFPIYCKLSVACTPLAIAEHEIRSNYPSK